MITPDIIILAALAIFIAFRLRSVLGKRMGHEQQKPPPRKPDRQERVIRLPDAAARRREELLEPPLPPAAASGVEAIKEMDPAFSVSAFLDGAKAAFEMVLEAFAKGDKRTLKNLLGPEAFARFEAEITGRKTAEKITETTLVSILSVLLERAALEKSLARLTLRFESEQITLVRDRKGQVVEGNPSQIDTVTDIWTFERDVTSPDPNWKLVETREGESVAG